MILLKSISSITRTIHITARRVSLQTPKKCIHGWHLFRRCCLVSLWFRAWEHNFLHQCVGGCAWDKRQLSKHGAVVPAVKKKKVLQKLPRKWSFRYRSVDVYVDVPVRTNAARTAPFIHCELLHAHMRRHQAVSPVPMLNVSGPPKGERAHAYMPFFSGWERSRNVQFYGHEDGIEIQTLVVLLVSKRHSVVW